MLSLSTLVVFKEAEFAPCTVSVRANAEQMLAPCHDERSGPVKRLHDVLLLPPAVRPIKQQLALHWRQ